MGDTAWKDCDLRYFIESFRIAGHWQSKELAKRVFSAMKRDVKSFLQKREVIDYSQLVRLSLGCPANPNSRNNITSLDSVSLRVYAKIRETGHEIKMTVDIGGIIDFMQPFNGRKKREAYITNKDASCCEPRIYGDRYLYFQNIIFAGNSEVQEALDDCKPEKSWADDYRTRFDNQIANMLNGDYSDLGKHPPQDQELIFKMLQGITGQHTGETVYTQQH